MNIHKRKVLNLIAPKNSVAFCITKTSHLVIQSFHSSAGEIHVEMT